MLRRVQVERLRDEGDIAPAYRMAIERDCSTLLVEYAEHYKTRTPSGVMP